MKGFKQLITAAALCASFSSSAYASSETGLGNDSSGTSDITVTVPNMASITGMADMPFTYTAGGADVDLDHDVCVYSNFATANHYSVKINGSANPKTTSPSSGFFVGNSTNDQEFAYTVKWNGASGTAGRAAATHNVKLTTGLTGATVPDCGGTPNANYSIQVPASSIQAVKAGAYTGTITILITPE